MIKILKKCNNCKEIKSIHLFVAEKRHKDGCSGKCRECRQSTRPKQLQVYNEKRKSYELEYLKRPGVFEKRQKIWANYYNKNKDKLKEYRNSRRFKNDELKISDNTRRLLRHYIFDNKCKINGKRILGIDRLEYRKYLEARFSDGFTWGNYGIYWEIDHIIPINKYDLTKEDELLRCFNYTNTQPLTSLDNNRKGNRIMV